MVLIPPLVSDLVKSVWSAPSISIDVLDQALLEKAILQHKDAIVRILFCPRLRENLPILSSQPCIFLNQPGRN